MSETTMDFLQLWLDLISKKKDLAEPQVPHVFSASDMPVARASTQLSRRRCEDIEYCLLVCRAASHTHSLDLFCINGEEGRDLSIDFPAFETCCQHPMLSHLNRKTRSQMRQRCRSDTIMTLSFQCDVLENGDFLLTDDGYRVTGTNLEEDRILCVTSDRGRVTQKQDSFSKESYCGALNRLFVNVREDIARRMAGFAHTRCSNVSRSAVLALLKIGEAMVNAVDKVVTAVKCGVPDSEVVWQQSGGTPFQVQVRHLKQLDGFDTSLDCEHEIDELAELLLSAANRQIVGVRKSFPPPAKLAKETHCIERRLLDYCKQTLLNNPSHSTMYAIRAACVEAHVLVCGLRQTLLSLCTSSLGEYLTIEEHADFYAASNLENILYLSRRNVNELSSPLTRNGCHQRTQRTKNLIEDALFRANVRQQNQTPLMYEDLKHDPEVLHLDWVSGNFELDLLRISDHIIEIGHLVDHDTEVRMLTLLVIGADMILQEIESTGEAKFYGLTVRFDIDVDSEERNVCVEMEDGGARYAHFVNLRALRSHLDVFLSMINFMSGPRDGVIDVSHPARNVPDRTIFVRNVLHILRSKGLTVAEAVETAVILAHVLASRRGSEMKEIVLVDSTIAGMVERVRGSIKEQQTNIDVADIVRKSGSDTVNVDHYGADSTGIQRAREAIRKSGAGMKFQLLDYSRHKDRYGFLNVIESAVEFNAEGQRLYAYCHEGRVFVRKRGLRENVCRFLGGSKIGLTVLGTGGTIELKASEPRNSDMEAMDLIMSRTKRGKPLARWIWSKILKGQIKYRCTQDSCMWNRNAIDQNAAIIARWSVPKWVLRHMLVLVPRNLNEEASNHILIQAHDDMPMYMLIDEGLTRYNCKLSTGDINKSGYRKCMLEPSKSCAGARHPFRQIT